jgi:hypothetical protein
MCNMKVAVISAFQGKKANIKLAQKYCKYVFDQGHYPFAAHLIYPQILDDNNPDERSLALEASKVFIKTCDEAWVFYKNKIPFTDGMKEEIEFAKSNNIEVKFYRVNKKGVIDKQLDFKWYAETTIIKFDDIAKKLKDGADYDSFKDALDKMLGTELPERDLELEERFERKNRQE